MVIQVSKETEGRSLTFSCTRYVSCINRECSIFSVSIPSRVSTNPASCVMSGISRLVGAQLQPAYLLSSLIHTDDVL